MQWANQEVFDPNENEQPIAFVVFRTTLVEAMRRWTAGGASGNARMKLSNHFNRQFTDHISTHEWEGVGSNDWRWTLCERSLASMGIVRMPLNDIMCVPSPTILLSLNEIIDWGMRATSAGQTLLEWCLMGHTLVPSNQAIGGGLMTDA